MRFIFLLFLCSISGQVVNGQASQNWHWKDYATDSVHGISLNKAYKLLATLPQKASPVIVAVIDGGIDTNHVALKNLLWRNPKEIPNNQLDDDKNGYVDDVHGWNFLGGKDGRNIDKAAAEMTRIYHRYKSIYDGKQIDTNQLSSKEKATYFIWKQTADEIKVAENDLSSIQYIKMASNAIKKMGTILLKELPDSNFTVSILESYQPIGRVTLDTKMAYLRAVKILGIEKESTYPEIVKDLEEYIEGKEKAASAQESAPPDVRADIIKDVYFNFSDKYYGNNDITGPNARHGTHVAGLVASIPDSGWEVNNLYPALKIMGIRTVPDGDEYDKDVALAIRYAVDNGAKVINASFGKDYSPHAQWVYDAIKYAASKDVLIVHAAGNDSKDIDTEPNFPTDDVDGKEIADNVLTVGALNYEYGEKVVADFSNYGKRNVDVYAPGVKIYAAIPDNKYKYLQGTSMASPNAAGVAALIREYYPNLKAAQVKQILMQSGTALNLEVIVDEKKIQIPFSDASVSGKIVNAYNALKMAEEMSNAIKKNPKL